MMALFLFERLVKANIEFTAALAEKRTYPETAAEGKLSLSDDNLL